MKSAKMNYFELCNNYLGFLGYKSWPNLFSFLRVISDITYGRLEFKSVKNPKEI